MAIRKIQDHPTTQPTYRGCHHTRGSRYPYMAIRKIQDHPTTQPIYRGGGEDSRIPSSGLSFEALSALQIAGGGRNHAERLDFSGIWGAHLSRRSAIGTQGVQLCRWSGLRPEWDLRDWCCRRRCCQGMDTSSWAETHSGIMARLKYRLYS
jgi:hypothetical protein